MYARVVEGIGAVEALSPCFILSASQLSLCYCFVFLTYGGSDLVPGVYAQRRGRRRRGGREAMMYSRIEIYVQVEV